MSVIEECEKHRHLYCLAFCLSFIEALSDKLVWSTLRKKLKGEKEKKCSIEKQKSASAPFYLDNCWNVNVASLAHRLKFKMFRDK